MPSAVLTPFVSSLATQPAGGGRIWEKKLLPVGQVNYKGRVLNFDLPYLQGLAAAYHANAYDQVPFQLADAANTHTNDPERFRGEILGMTTKPDGLYVVLGATPAGDKVLRENPNLGVSARIVEDYARSDGKVFPAAVQHVLGTLDPRIPGMGGWQQVEFANWPGNQLIIDLTGESFTGEAPGGTMPEMTPEQQARLAKLLEIPEDQFDRLVAGLGTAQPPAAPAGGGDGSEYELTDEELAELLAAAEELDNAGALEPAGAGAGGATGLSAEAAMAIEMANYRADENERQLAVLNGHLAEEQFLRERAVLAEQHGIPPYITDLARPLLEGTGHVVEMSNGAGVDAGQVMRKVLTEVGKTARMLDLGFEMGSGMDEPAQQGEAATARAEIVGRAKAQMFGIR
jgi:hypothetical protein